MTRSRLRSTVLRLALPGVILGLAACSFSFRTGSRPADEAGKPAEGTTAEPAKSPGKPVAGAETDEPDQPAEASEPSAETPAEPPAAEPTEATLVTSATAVCRVRDETLEAMCHRVLDPIAANDIEAWVAVLDDAVVLTRRSFEAGSQRLDGPNAVRKVSAQSGGLHPLLHVAPSDRIVGTVAIDCRDCRRAFVAFEANTRSGTIELYVDMGQPPMVTTVSVGSNLIREPLPEAKPTLTPKPAAPADPPPKKDAPAKGTTLEAPKQTKGGG